MRYCFSCGKNLVDGASFCSHCGKEQIAASSADNFKKTPSKRFLPSDWKFWTVMGLSLLFINTAYNIYTSANRGNKTSNSISDKERDIYSDFRNLGTIISANVRESYDTSVKTLTEVPPQFLRGTPSDRSSVRVVENKIYFQHNDRKHSIHEGYYVLVNRGKDETDVYCYTSSELLMKACEHYKNKGR